MKADLQTLSLSPSLSILPVSNPFATFHPCKARVGIFVLFCLFFWQGGTLPTGVLLTGVLHVAGKTWSLAQTTPGSVDADNDQNNHGRGGRYNHPSLTLLALQSSGGGAGSAGGEQEDARSIRSEPGEDDGVGQQHRHAHHHHVHSSAGSQCLKRHHFVEDEDWEGKGEEGGGGDESSMSHRNVRTSTQGGGGGSSSSSRKRKPSARTRRYACDAACASLQYPIYNSTLTQILTPTPYHTHAHARLQGLGPLLQASTQSATSF